MLAISETWLTSGILNVWLSIPDCILIDKAGLGMFLSMETFCLKDGIIYIDVSVEVFSTLVVFLFFAIILYYCPSFTFVFENESLMLFLSELCLGKDEVVLRDFNLTSIKWTEDLTCSWLSLTDVFITNFSWAYTMDSCTLFLCIWTQQV